MITVKTTPIKIAKKNEKDWPSEYTCNFLEAGLVSYEDAGAGIAMLRKETILKMLPTFVGKPVVVNHIDVTPRDFKNHAVGYITKTWFDDYSGWAMCSFILTDDAAKEKVARGYSVSCAYDVLSTGKGGDYHAIRYDEEITGGSGTHLALVTSPRYEDAKIQPCMMLVNSKKAVMKEGEGKKENGKDKVECPGCLGTGKDKRGKTCDDCGGKGYRYNATENNKQKEDTKMIKVYKRANDKAGAEVDPNDPTKQKWNAETLFAIVNNEYVPLTELAKHAKVKTNEFVEVQSVENEIEINGVVHNMSDLVENYLASKKNADEEEAKKKEDEKKNADEKAKAEEEEKKNAEEKGKKDQEEEEEQIKKENEKAGKKDAKHFVKLNTVRENGVDQTVVQIDTLYNRVNRGVEKYGTTKKD